MIRKKVRCKKNLNFQLKKKKVCCKKTLEFQLRYFYKGKNYVAEIDTGTITMDEIMPGIFVFDGCDNINVKSGLWFSSDKNHNHQNLFSDYFYSEQELRKLKLKKINNIKE